MNRIVGRTAIPLPLALLTTLSACSAPETDEHAEAPVAAATSALEEETLCHEAASPPPLEMRWSFDTGTVHQRSADANVQLDLEAREELAIDLRLVSERLDARSVSQDYGHYTLAAGEPVTVDVRLGDLPLQAVSHSATASVEATVIRDNDTIVAMRSPVFHHHFASNYETIVTYPYHVMVETFRGGQVNESSAEIEGRVLSGGEWRDIEDHRLLEYDLTTPFIPSIDVFLPELHDPLPMPPFGQRLCLDWRVQHLDAGHGEDIASTRGVQAIDASHALVTIEKVTDLYGCSAHSPGACGEIVGTGPLDGLGCTFVPDSEIGDQYFVWLHGRFEKGAEGTISTAEIRYYPRAEGESIGLPTIRLSAVHLPEGLGSPYQPFEPPRPELDVGQDHVFVVWREWQNAAAVISRLFKSPFLTPGSDITVHANRGCLSTNPDIPVDDACVRGSSIYTGPWTEVIGEEPWGWTLPGGLQYKYILAHEVGHVAMNEGSGGPANDYSFRGAPHASCRCDHVTGANQLHCLQSVEYASAAQVEGFAHFVAASLFNDREGSDCHFNYYKEFREDDGTVRSPPYSVDCRNPVAWRDSHEGCFYWEAGTEYDWMQFYWNVNNVGANTSTTADLFAIYRDACGGRCGPADHVSWSALDDAAEHHFGMDDQRYLEFRDRGDGFGIDEDP